MFAKNRIVSKVNVERSGAPSRIYCPLRENSEQRVKQVKIKDVDKKAVAIIDGLIRITVSNSGPNPKPVKKANPRSSPILVLTFFPFSSGVAKSVSKHPMPANEVKKFPEKRSVKRCMYAPAAAVRVDSIKQV